MPPSINYYWDTEDPAHPFMYSNICNDLSIVPDNATRVKPPSYNPGTIPCWEDEMWTVRADWRQEVVYDINTGERAQYPTVDVDEEYFKKHYTTTPPTSEYDKWDGEKWVLDKAAKSRANISVLNAHRREGIALATVQIGILEDGIAFLEEGNEDASRLTTLLNEWKRYRGQLVILKFTTGNESIPTQPVTVENMDG